MTDWNPATVRRWLEARIAAARADQVAAERGGQRDDCDKAAAEEMVCAAVRSERATPTQAAFVGELKGMLERDEHVWRGVYDDDRFDWHVRAYLRKPVRMAKANDSFGNLARYQQGLIFVRAESRCGRTR